MEAHHGKRGKDSEPIESRKFPLHITSRALDPLYVRSSTGRTRNTSSDLAVCARTDEYLWSDASPFLENGFQSLKLRPIESLRGQPYWCYRLVERWRE